MTSAFHIKLFTLFPEMFPGYLGLSLSGKALEKGLWSFESINPRAYATDMRKTIDDAPLGGGAGMVMKPDILAKTFEAHKPLGRFLYMSPRGRLLTQDLVQDLAKESLISILCGRYEGVDQRLLDAYGVEEISAGDYVLSGGEPAAMIMLDACIRLLPGTVGNEGTHDEESFSSGLLEYPHYTRPAEWVSPDGILRKAPEVLASGHHAKVNEWRRHESEKITQQRRPDLWSRYAPPPTKKKT